MNERTLVAKAGGKLAIVEVVQSDDSIVLSSAQLTEALLRTVEGYSAGKIKALKLASPIVKVCDQATLAAATEAKGHLAAVRIDAEKDRKTFTQPFLDSQRFIKEQFDLLSNGITREEKRLDALIQVHAAEVERKRQEQIADQQRLAAEQARKARDLQQEVERREREARKAMERANECGDGANIEEAEAAQEALEEATYQAEMQSLEAPPVIEIAAPVGKAMLDFEIESAGTRHEAASMQAFVKAWPQFCDIKPRRAAIIEELNSGAAFGAEPGTIPAVPGLRIFEKFRTPARAIR